MCNSSRGEKSESSAPLQGPPSRSTRGGFGFFSLARFGDRESRTFGRCWLVFTRVRGRWTLRTSPYMHSANFAFWGFYEVELRLTRVLGSSHLALCVEPV